MSRIGRQPIAIPAGVEVKIEGSLVSVKGPKGETSRLLNKDMILKLENSTLTVDRPTDNKEHRAMHGLTRTLIANMVTGVTQGFSRTLEINGVGYRAAVNGNTLELQLGYSHPINYPFPQDVKMSVEKNVITIVGDDKQVIGQIAAEVRSFRAPEPYKGKGIKYVDETIIRKAGKTSKK